MSAHRYDNQEILLSVLQSTSLVQVYQDMEKRLVWDKIELLVSLD